MGHSAGGLSLTDVIHSRFAEQIHVAVYVAANMLKYGFCTDQDFKDVSFLNFILFAFFDNLSFSINIFFFFKISFSIILPIAFCFFPFFFPSSFFHDMSLCWFWVYRIRKENYSLIRFLTKGLGFCPFISTTKQQY